MTLPHTIKDGSLLPWQVRANFDAVDNTIIARYKTEAGILVNGYQIIDFEEKDYDTENCVTTGSNWKFTCPKSGYYRVSSMIFFTRDGNYAVNNVAASLVYKNGSSWTYLDYYDAQVVENFYISLSGSTIIYLNKNDFVQIVGRNSRTGGTHLYASNSFNWVCIERICS